MTLTIPSIPTTSDGLQNARGRGAGPRFICLEVLRRELSRVERVKTLLASVHEEFERSGMSEEELTDLLEKAKHDLRREQRARAS